MAVDTVMIAVCHVYNINHFNFTYCMWRSQTADTGETNKFIKPEERQKVSYEYIASQQ